jgi:hypothetical protein
LHSVLYKKIIDRLYTILQKNGGTDTKPMGKTEPQFLSDPMSDRKKKFSPTLIPNVWYNSYLKFCPKGIDQCLILFLNYIIFIVFTPLIHFQFQPNPFVKRITTRLVICIYISQWHNVFHTTIDL